MSADHVRAGRRVQITPSAVVTTAVSAAVIGVACARDRGVACWFVWSLIAGAVLFGSTASHEVGHVLMALHRGLTIHRVRVTRCLGANVVRQRSATLSDEIAVCVAGPAVSAALIGVGLALLCADSTALHTLGLMVAVVNAVALASSMPPIPGSDGTNVRRAIARRQHGPTHSDSANSLMSSGCRETRGSSVLVGVEVAVDDAGEAALYPGEITSAVRRERCRAWTVGS